MDLKKWIQKVPRQYWLWILVAVCVIAIVCAILLLGKGCADSTVTGGTPSGAGASGDSSSSQVSGDRDDLYDRNKFSSGYYYLGQASPELKETRITAIVNEMYYTNGGHLFVGLTLGNGTGKTVRLDSLSVKVINGYTDEVIADGYTEDIADSYTIPAGGTNTYSFFIPPEQVKIANDPFEALTFTINALGTAL